MTDRKEKYPKSYLSKQQKEILKTVCSDKPELTNAKTLSWDIARFFNTKQGNRITKNKNKEEILSKTHNASMSRSLKALRERDLLTDFGTKTHYGATEAGLNWCELNEIKEKRERMRTERIKKEVKSI